MKLKIVHVMITGRVQGIGYRLSVQKRARQLGVKGWIKNMLDGRVEGVFQGKDQEIEQLLSFCKNDVSLAQVTQMWVKEIPLEKLFSDFMIIQ